jgi:hypothetical protein
VLHLTPIDERSQTIRQPPLQVVRNGEFPGVEKDAPGSGGTGRCQRFASFGLRFAGDVVSLAVWPLFWNAGFLVVELWITYLPGSRVHRGAWLVLLRPFP